MIARLSATRFFTLQLVPSRGALIWRALLTAALGLLLLVRPLLTITVLTVLIGFLLVFDGAWMIAAGCRAPKGSARTFGIVFGSLSVLLGLLAAAAPAIMDMAGVIVLGAWLILDACGDLRAGFSDAPRHRLYLLSALLSLLLGALLVLAPLAGLKVLIQIGGALLLVYGGFLLLLGLTAPKIEPPVRG